MVGYGAWALSRVERFPGLRTLELEHLYYQTRGQRLAASVVATVPAEHVAHEWRTKVEPQVEAMKAHAQAARAADVPANYGPACAKYGGCPFVAKCLTGENKTMSLRDKLLNKAPTIDTAGEHEDPELPAVLPPDAPAPTPVQTAPEATQATEQPAPKRRGRPRKAADPELPKGEMRVLFVDCIPTAFDGPKPESLTSYVDTMHRKVAEAGGVDDVRFAGADSALGFGKWRGALAMAVRAELPPPGAYLALGVAQSELTQVIVEALEPSFDVVVRGTRS